MPCLAAKIAELADETGSECHSSAGGDEVKFVDACLGVELFGCVLAISGAVAERLRVEAILAAERAAVERYKRSHAFAVGGKPVPRYSY